MSKSNSNSYRVEDEDGDGANVVFVHRFCGCMLPGCVDDTIEIYEDGEIHPYRLDVPRLMTPYLEALFDNSMKAVKNK